jgi:hypothetical protein
MGSQERQKMHGLRFILPVLPLLGIALGRPAQAQVQYRSSPANLPPSQTQAVARPTAYPVAPAPVYAPPPGYGYPGYPVRQGPVAGALNGQANLVNAVGQYQTQYRQGQLLNQEVEREKMKTRQMFNDQLAYEEAMKPKAEDVRDQQRLLEQRRARNDPPLNEIWSGKSLNVLLAAINDIQIKQGVRGPLVPLGEPLLKHVNVSGRPTELPPTVLRDGGRVRWSLVLQDPRFTKERETIDQLLPQAVKEVRMDSPQFTTFKALRDGVDALDKKIGASARDLSIQDLIIANRSLDEVSKAVSLLKQPNAANYFNGSWEARGNNVAELVDHLSRNGLRFAPAGTSDQTYYSALYHSMLTYDSGLSRLASR